MRQTGCRNNGADRSTVALLKNSNFVYEKACRRITALPRFYEAADETACRNTFMMDLMAKKMFKEIKARWVGSSGSQAVTIID